MLSLRFLCRSALLLGIATASLSAEEYAIKLDRPQKVGDVRRVSASASRKMSLLMKSGDQTIKDDKQDVRAELVATEKVLAVNESGRPIALGYVVEKFECETPAGKHAIGNGKVVIGKLEGEEERYEIKDGDLPDEAKQAFELVATLESQKSSDDDVFGTDKPQAVGASWPVAAEKAVKDLAEQGVVIEPSDLVGSVKLVSTKQAGGRECLEISGSMKASKMKFSEVPALNIESSDVSATIWGLFPTDLSMPRSEEKADMSMSLTGKLDAGAQTMTMKIDVRQELKRTFSAAKSSD